MIKEGIPSQQHLILRAIREASIVRMTRYSWVPKESSVLGGVLRPQKMFSRTAGPVLLTLESGLVIGAASQPSLMSVTLWLDDALEAVSDPELQAIEADDLRFSEPAFAQMLGKRVAAIAILTRAPENMVWESCPREVGVVISFHDAAELILSHGLHDNSDDFSVLTREDVDSALWSRLQVVRVL